MAAAIDEQRAVMGENYWSYNIADNVRSLEAMMTFAHQFGLTREKLDYEDFFHPEAAALEGVLAASESDYASLIRPTGSHGKPREAEEGQLRQSDLRG